MLNTDNKNYYDVLDIQTTATHQEVQEAYSRAKNTYSTDSAAMYSLLTTDECKAMLDQIEEAYSVLGVPEKKAQYDKARGLNSGPKLKREDFLKKEDKQASQEIQKPTEEFTLNKDSLKQENSNATKTYAKSRFSLDFTINSEMEEKISGIEIFTGELLKEIREYKNVSIERMSDMTKVGKTHIRNIEEENKDKLPADVYTRGFVYQYAKCLKLDADTVAKTYLNYIKNKMTEDNE